MAQRQAERSKQSPQHQSAASRDVVPGGAAVQLKKDLRGSGYQAGRALVSPAAAAKGNNIQAKASVQSSPKEASDRAGGPPWDMADIREVLRLMLVQKPALQKSSGKSFWSSVVSALESGDRWVQGLMGSGPKKGFVDLSGVTLTTSNADLDTYGPAIWGNPQYEVNVDLLLDLAGAMGKSLAIGKLGSFKGAKGRELYDRVKERADFWAGGVETIEQLIQEAVQLAETHGDPQTAGEMRDKLEAWRSYGSVEEAPAEDASSDEGETTVASAELGELAANAGRAASASTTEKMPSGTSTSGDASKSTATQENSLQPAKDETIVGEGKNARIEKKKDVVVRQYEGTHSLNSDFLKLKYANGRSQYYIDRGRGGGGWDRYDRPGDSRWKPEVATIDWKGTHRRRKNADGSWSSKWTGSYPQD